MKHLKTKLKIFLYIILLSLLKPNIIYSQNYIQSAQYKGPITINQLQKELQTTPSLIAEFKPTKNINENWLNIQVQNLQESIKLGIKQYIFIISEDKLEFGNPPKKLLRLIHLLKSAYNKNYPNSTPIKTTIIVIPNKTDINNKDNKTITTLHNTSNQTNQTSDNLTLLQLIKQSYAPPKLNTSGHIISILSSTITSGLLTSITYFNGDISLTKAAIITLFSIVVSITTISFAEFRYNLAFSFRLWSQNIFYKKENNKILEKWVNLINQKLQKENIAIYGLKALKKLGLVKYAKKTGFEIYKFILTQGQMIFETIYDLALTSLFRIIIGPINGNPKMTSFKGLFFLIANRIQGLLSYLAAKSPLDYAYGAGLLNIDKTLKWAVLGSIVMSIGSLADFGFQLSHALTTTTIGLIGISIQKLLQTKYPLETFYSLENLEKYALKTKPMPPCANEFMNFLAHLPNIRTIILK